MMHSLKRHVMHFYKSKCDSAISSEPFSFRLSTFIIHSSSILSDVLPFAILLGWLKQPILYTMQALIIPQMQRFLYVSVRRWRSCIRTQCEYDGSGIHLLWLKNKTEAVGLSVSLNCSRDTIQSIPNHFPRDFDGEVLTTAAKLAERASQSFVMFFIPQLWHANRSSVMEHWKRAFRSTHTSELPDDALHILSKWKSVSCTGAVKRRTRKKVIFKYIILLYRVPISVQDWMGGPSWMGSGKLESITQGASVKRAILDPPVDDWI